MSLVFVCLLQTLPVFPNIIWNFELYVLGISPAKSTDGGHANLCLAVFTGIMHQPQPDDRKNCLRLVLALLNNRAD